MGYNLRVLWTSNLLFTAISVVSASNVEHILESLDFWCHQLDVIDGT